MSVNGKLVIPETTDEVKQWMAECDAGLHPLPPDFQEKIAASWETLKAHIWGNQEQSFAE